jgi:ABC-type tungstate transport system permease subunit
MSIALFEIGRALEMGRRGDADVLLTHAPAAEQTMIGSFGIERFGMRLFVPEMKRPAGAN